MLLPGNDSIENVAFENSYEHGYYMRKINIEILIRTINEWRELLD